VPKKRKIQKPLTHTDILVLLRRIDALDKHIESFKCGRYPGWYKQVKKLGKERASIRKTIDGAREEEVDKAYDLFLRG
jgi:hypothetical protein